MEIVMEKNEKKLIEIIKSTGAIEVTKVEKNVTLNSVMSNSFGFGGTNATLIFEKG